MQEITLNQVSVSFDNEAHTYTNQKTGESLSGITSILKQKVCPSEYANVSEEVLMAAAERGHKVHNTIELCDSLGVDSTTPEYKSYNRIKQENGLSIVENEYLVTDGKQYASCIDLVMTDETGDIILADIKTTYKLNREYVSWQLSVYAYLFELINPSLKVARIYAMWLRDEKSEWVELPRKTKEEVESVLYDDNYIAVVEIPAYVTNVEDRLCEIAREKAALEQEEKQIKAKLYEQMKAGKAKSWDTGKLLVTIRKASTRTSFDSNKFKSEHGDLYGQYVKTTEVPESISIKVRD